jgi:hypothetical protein
LTALSDDAFDAIGSSIQGALLVAQRSVDPDVARLIADTANQAFVAGMTTAILAGATVLILAAVATFLIVPAHVQRIEASAAPARSRIAIAHAGEPGD